MKQIREIARLVIIISIFFGLIFTPTLYVKSDWDPEIVAISENIQFPDKSHSTLSYTIETTATYGSDPQIYYSIDEFINDPYTRYFYIWVDDTKILDTTISNDKSGIIDVPGLKNYGTHTIKLEIYYGAYGDGCYKLDYLKIGRLFWNQNVDKYAVFFWQEFDSNDPTDSGIISENRIDDYWALLEDDGFTIINHMNTNDWRDDMDDLDALEDSNDIIFIYIAGHGYYVTGNDVSTVRVSPSGDITWIQSDFFDNYIANLESTRILVVVDACECGDFKDKLNMNGVSVITSTDESHDGEFEARSYWPVYAEPVFSNDFFNKIFTYDTYSSPTRYLYYDDILSFDYAKSQNPTYYSLSNFLALHSLFGP
ncbi:MAG: hypothetical protein FK734_08300 [Asgard group archaeon]|nr:hypothetical protein [Asgard group archaeon]